MSDIQPKYDISPRSLDHFVIAVKDANESGSRYERLGFQVLPLMRHIELGTCNRIVQLNDTYFELIADLDKSPPVLRERMLPRYVCGEGLAIVSLTSSDLEADLKTLEHFDPFPSPIVNARRKITMPGGDIDETDSRCIYFWRASRLYSMLFYSQHFKPHTIFVSAYQRHPNGSLRIRKLTYMSVQPRRDLEYASTLVGAQAVRNDVDWVGLTTARGETLEYLSPERVQERYTTMAPTACPSQDVLGVALTIEVSDLAHCRAVLERNGARFETLPKILRVPGAEASGVILDFVEPG